MSARACTIGVGLLAGLPLAGCVGGDIRGDEKAVVVPSGEHSYAVVLGRRTARATLEDIPLYISDEQFAAEALGAIETVSGCAAVDLELDAIVARAALEC